MGDNYNMSIWNDMCEAAVLYGYHPAVAYELTSVVNNFPRARGVLQGIYVVILKLLTTVDSYN